MRSEESGSRLLVCPRVSDLPRPKDSSRRASCEKCHESIWRASDSPDEAIEICVQCALILRGPKPEQSQDANVSDDEKKRPPLMWRDVSIALVLLGALCAVLSFLVGRSITAPMDFVERYFGFSPDGGNGS